MAEQRGDIRELWRDDLVAFLLGCSLTFEHALVEAGVPLRNVERNTMISMFVSNLACAPAGRFHGPMVVTMRPIAAAQVDLVCELSARYPHAHGAPIHIGAPEAIGITEIRDHSGAVARKIVRTGETEEIPLPTELRPLGAAPTEWEAA